MPIGPKIKKQPEAPAQPAVEPPHQYTGYHDAFPKSEGPPPVRNYEGKAALAPSEDLIVVELDAGAFRALWEMAEARAKQQWEARNSMPSVAAYVRAVRAFREAWKRHQS